MGYLEESLAPGEAVIARFRLHWTAKWRLYAFLLLAIPTFGIALLAAAYEWLRLRAIEQGVTNRRVVRKTGIVSRETEELRLGSIETVELRQSSKFMKENQSRQFAEFLKLLAGLVADGQRAGLFDESLDPHIVARAIFGMLDELALAWLLGRGEKFDMVRAADSLGQLVLQGLERRSS